MNQSQHQELDDLTDELTQQEYRQSDEYLDDAEEACDKLRHTVVEVALAASHITVYKFLQHAYWDDRVVGGEGLLVEHPTADGGLFQIDGYARPLDPASRVGLVTFELIAGDGPACVLKGECAAVWGDGRAAHSFCTWYQSTVERAVRLWNRPAVNALPWRVTAGSPDGATSASADRQTPSEQSERLRAAFDVLVKQMKDAHPEYSYVTMAGKLTTAGHECQDYDIQNAWRRHPQWGQWLRADLVK